MLRSRFTRIGHVSSIFVALILIFVARTASAEPWAYIEPQFGPRFALGDEETRAGRAHFVHGDYGLAEMYYRRAVEATPRNSAAWLGLAASYDRLNRFDLADRAYRHVARLYGYDFVVLNNLGYSYMLRGNRRRARDLLSRAHALAPGNPTILNNIAVLEAGQDYYWGRGP